MPGKKLSIRIRIQVVQFLLIRYRGLPVHFMSMQEGGLVRPCALMPMNVQRRCFYEGKHQCQVQQAGGEATNQV